ncbi:hypothetical protein Pst134EB_023772 [Puccinia striiformis f. sp. tritici]|nr:hypothetical protein Pst134EB_023772 [Puccinia striiformis f. sp. tritici]
MEEKLDASESRTNNLTEEKPAASESRTKGALDLFVCETLDFETLELNVQLRQANAEISAIKEILRLRS